MILALGLSAAGVGGFVYLLSFADGWKGWMIIASGTFGFIGLYWLWADFINAGPATGKMIPRNVWAAALLMVKRYGDDAMLEAAQKADQMLDEGDMAGAETWHRILNAIERLQAQKPAEGEGVHRRRAGATGGAGRARTLDQGPMFLLALAWYSLAASSTLPLASPSPGGASFWDRAPPAANLPR